MFTALILLYSGTQTAAVKYVFSNLEEETNRRFSISKIDISLTKGVEINNVFIEDANKDTLVYAELISVKANLLSFLSDKLLVNKVELKNTTVKITSGADSVFNFQYIVNKFAEEQNTVVSEPKDSTTTNIPINLNSLDVVLDNVNFVFYSKTTGIDVQVRDVDIALNTDTIEFTTMKYYADNIDLKNANVAVTMFGKDNDEDDSLLTDSFNLILAVGANRVDLQNVKFKFEDSADSLFIYSDLQEGVVFPGIVDIPNQIITAKSINLSKSSTKVIFDKKVIDIAGENINNNEPIAIIPQIDWEFLCDNILLKESYFSFNDNSEKDTSNGFDYNHFSTDKVSIELINTEMNNDVIKGQIKSLKTQAKNNYNIKQLKVDAKITKQQLLLNQFNIELNESKIIGDIDIRYKSFNKFITQNFKADSLNVNIKQSNISLADVNYFYNTDTIEFVGKSKIKSIKIQTNLHGNDTFIRVERMNLSVLENTSLTFNANVYNYTDTSKININTEIDLFKTTRNELGFLVNDSVNLPKYIIVKADVDYCKDSLSVVSNIKTDIGEADIIADLKGEKYKLDANLYDNDLSLLLDSVKLENVNLVLKAKGDGFSINDELDLKISIDSLWLNNNMLKDIELTANNINSEGYNVFLNSDNDLLNLNLNSNIVYQDSSFTVNIKSVAKKISLKDLGFIENRNDFGFAIKADIFYDKQQNLNSIFEIDNFKNRTDVRVAHFNSIKSTINITDTLSVIKINSELLVADINSNYNILKTKDVLGEYLTKYFSNKDTVLSDKNLNLNIVLNDKNIVESNIIDGLTELNTEPIIGSFVSKEDLLNFKSKLNRIAYKDFAIDSFNIDVFSSNNLINYNSTVNSIIAYDSLKVDLLSLKGMLSNDSSTFEFTNKEKNTIKYNFGLYYVSRSDSLAQIGILPNVIIDSLKFNAPVDNKLLIGDNYFKAEKFELNNNDQKIFVISEDDNKTLTTYFENVNLKQFSGKYIFKRDFISGILRGYVSFDSKGLNKTSIKVDELVLFQEYLGSLNINVNLKNKSQDFELSLIDKESELKVEGEFVNNKTLPSFHINMHKFQLHKFQFFMKGMFNKVKGELNGELSYDNLKSNTILEGLVSVDNVEFRSKYRNSTVSIDKQTIKIIDDNLILDNFTIKDSLNNKFNVSGRINNLSLNSFELDLKMNVKNFLIYDVLNDGDNLLYGKLILDNYSTIKGNNNKIVVDSDIKLKKCSEVTYVYPKNKMANEISTEGVVEFYTTDEEHKLSVLDTLTKNWISNLEVNSTINIDKSTKFNLIFDKNSGEGLIIEGGASLSLNITNNGDVNLAGNYTVEKGMYDISYYNIVGRKFKIIKGSKILWDGDPLNPIADLTAEYKVRAHPYPIMLNTTSKSSAELNKYKTSETFFVALNISKELLHPEMTFKIRYPRLSENSNSPDVRARINQINEDPAQVNKQAMSLLIISGFVTDDGNYVDGGNTIINNSVSSILTGQLNNISDRYMTGVDFDVDVNSRSNYNTSGSVENTSTDVKLKMKKYLFENRVVVEVAGGVTVNEGASNVKNDAGIQDAAVEYLITEDGKYKLRAFSQRDYSTINQDVQQTGISFVFTTDFDSVKELFKNLEIEKDTNIAPSTTIKQDTIVKPNTTIKKDSL